MFVKFKALVHCPPSEYAHAHMMIRIDNNRVSVHDSGNYGPWFYSRVNNAF